MSDARARRPSRKILVAVVVSLALLATIILSWPRARFQAPPLPVPNGIDDLVRAGGMIQGQPPKDLLTADEAALHAFVDPNGEALDLARIGLGRPCVVPLGASRDGGLETGMHRLGKLRSLSRLLVASGRLAEREDRPSDALRDYRDDILLGHDATRGGLLIDVLLGIACERPGLDGLTRLVDKLDAKQCRELLGELVPLDRDREEIAGVIAREQGWFRETAGWQERFLNLVNAGAINKLTQPAYRASETASEKARLRLRILLATLALRAYRLEHGEAPASMAALVPEYLPAVPRDPADGKAFRLNDEPGDGPRLDEMMPAPGPDDEPKPTSRVVPSSQ